MAPKRRFFAHRSWIVFAALTHSRWVSATCAIVLDHGELLIPRFSLCCEDKGVSVHRSKCQTSHVVSEHSAGSAGSTRKRSSRPHVQPCHATKRTGERRPVPLSLSLCFGTCARASLPSAISTSLPIRDGGCARSATLRRTCPDGMFRSAQQWRHCEIAAKLGQGQ